MKGGLGKCKFCEEVIMPRLKSKDDPFNVSDDAYKTYLDIVKVRDAIGFCRQFPVCEKHLDVLKRDNRMRINKGIEIPKSLSLLIPITNNII